MLSRLSGPRKASYLLLALSLYAAAKLGLGHALVGGLFASMMLHEADRLLRQTGSSETAAKWWSVAVFAVVGALFAVVLGSFAKIGMERLPQFLDNLLPRLESLAARFNVDFPVDNAQELRALVLDQLKSNARSVTTLSGLLTRGFFQLVIVLVVAVLHFLWKRSGPARSGRRGGLDERLLDECGARISLFAESFDKVMGAQILIAAINAGLAFAFMLAFRVPFRTMLTLATFVFGLFPIVGNLISNSLIVGAALTRSENLAIAALVFLVVVHKGGYFLNSRILGARIETPTWVILLGLLVGDAALGVTGAILAPTLIHYVREELRAVPD